jgi:hypothetical protein
MIIHIAELDRQRDDVAWSLLARAGLLVDTSAA